jgi:hypothetical protein
LFLHDKKKCVAIGQLQLFLGKRISPWVFYYIMFSYLTKSAFSNYKPLYQNVGSTNWMHRGGQFLLFLQKTDVGFSEHIMFILVEVSTFKPCTVLKCWNYQLGAGRQNGPKV